MTEVVERDITLVLIDPENERLFSRMDDSELDLLAASIAEVGIIQPITVRADGRIIAGEQRYRAALRVGLATVPVIVREDITESEVEKIRIHENIMRRGMKPSEQARGIARLYELNGIAEGRPGTTAPRSSLRTVAEQIGWTTTKVGVYHTLANLIEPLQRRWDAGEITRDVAYQIAQLSEGEQYAVAAVLSEAGKVPDLRDEIAGYKREIERIRGETGVPPAEREQALSEELVKLRLDYAKKVDEIGREHDDTRRRLRGLERKMEYAQQWAAQDRVHLGFVRLAAMLAIDPREYVARLDGFDALNIFLTSDLEVAEDAQQWLRDYSHALRERLSLPQQGLKGVR